MNGVAAPSILTAIMLAGCSAEKHPTDDQLKTVLETTLLPQIIKVQSLTVRYSPMKQAAGTSLPSGSLLATCKVVAKLNQDLCVRYDQVGFEVFEPEVIKDLRRRAELARVHGLELSECLSVQPWEQADKNLYEEVLGPVLAYPYPPRVMVYLKSHAGQTVQFDTSIAAVPQIDSWQLAVLDDSGWLRLQDTLGLPISFYPSDSVRYGTPEGDSYVAECRSAVEKYETTRNQIIEKYKKRLMAVVDRYRSLIEQNAVVVGTLTNPVGVTEKIRGKFVSSKENEGTLSIAKESDSDEHAAIFYVRLATVPSSESRPAVVSAVNKTITLTPKRGGYLGEIPTVAGDPYLGIDGNKLSGYVGAKVLKLDIN